MNEHPCERCRKSTSNPKFCSKTCSAFANAKRSRRRGGEFVCVVCGIVFEREPTGTRTTCSDKCLSKSVTGKPTKYTPETLFVCDKNIPRSQVKKFGIRWGFLKLQCDGEDCGITEWHGKPAPLQLEHINGIGYDHRLENLCMLCANCHAQTDTYCGKNTAAAIANRTKAPDLVRNCSECEKQLSLTNHTGRCRVCAAKQSRLPTKIDWPNTDILLEMLKGSNYTQLAKTMGVSDSAIRKRIKNHQRVGSSPVSAANNA